MRSIVSAAVVLVLLFVPFAGSRADSGTFTFDISVFNSGFIVPDSYVYVFSSAFVDDGDMISSEDFYVSASVGLVSDVSGLYGSVQKTATLYTSQFYREALALRSDDIFEWTGKHFIVSSFDFLSVYNSVSPVDDITSNFVAPVNNMFSLVSGYPLFSVLNFGEYGFPDVTLSTIVQKVLSQGVSINGSSATSIEASSVEGLLTLPTPPPAQRDFLDTSSISRFGYYIGNFIPQTLLLPLFSFIGFCLLMMLFAIIKHA